MSAAVEFAASLNGASNMAQDITLGTATACELSESKRPSIVGMQIEIITDLASFEGLEAEWNALYESNYRDQLSFQSHAWLRSWLATFSTGPDFRSHKLAIVTLRVNGHLRVVCPLIVKHFLGMTHLTWLGLPASQYGDVITDGTSASNELVAAAMNHAVHTFKPDVIRLRKVRGDAAVMPWLKGQKAIITNPDTARYLDFRDASSMEGYCARYSSKSRKNRRRLRRRLEETGTVSTKVLTCGYSARDAVRTAMEFKKQWLLERGHVSSALRDQHMSDFFANFVEKTCRSARPFVSIMHCGATPVSVQFGIISKRRLAMHMIAYNPETEKTGAGVLHIEDTLEYCINSGLTELDFLAPDAAYKEAWADAEVPVADYVVSLSIRGRLYTQGYLCGTRDLLKTKVATLPLSLRQNIAKRMNRS